MCGEFLKPQVDLGGVRIHCLPGPSAPGSSALLNNGQQHHEHYLGCRHPSWVQGSHIEPCTNRQCHDAHRVPAPAQVGCTQDPPSAASPWPLSSVPNPSPAGCSQTSTQCCTHAVK